MAQAEVTQLLYDLTVEFFAYRKPELYCSNCIGKKEAIIHYTLKKHKNKNYCGLCKKPFLYYCSMCIDEIAGHCLKEEEENAYLTIGRKKAVQFTLKEHKSIFNYCGLCKNPLYRLLNARCQRSSPTSRRFVKRFQRRRRSGPRAGGI